MVPQLSFCLVAVATCALAQSSLDSRISERLTQFQGKVSIHAKNLKTGAEYDRNGGNRVVTASSIKLPIMIGVYIAVQDGRAKWTDTSTLTSDNKVPGSGVLQQLSDGLQLNLKDLMRLMILLSDNTATNLVLDHVSGNDVNAVMDKLGAKNTRSLRKILIWEPNNGTARSPLAALVIPRPETQSRGARCRCSQTLSTKGYRSIRQCHAAGDERG